MEITLVTSSHDKLVHGTENEKKTGCGINLLKPENVTRFHRTSRMTDLKEITCEKCKASLAKKLIKADKKEMSLLLKEEKKREKMGMNDTGIVPLGNTTARITRDPDAKRKEEEARRKAQEEQRKAAEEKRKAEEAAKEAEEQELYARFNGKPQNNIPGTGIAMDESLAQFAINAPQKEEPTPAAVPEDDFLAQFAINKPADATAAAPAAAAPQDDFLAQFAIPTPAQEPTQNTDPILYGNTPADNYGTGTYEQPAQTAPVHNDDDIMNLFSINPQPAQEPAYTQPDYSQPAYGQPDYSQPVYGQPDYTQPVYGQPDYTQPVIYDGTQPLYDAQGNLITGIVTPVGGVPQDAAQTEEWDFVANQLFGIDSAAADNNAATAINSAYDGVPSDEMAGVDLPVIDDISAPAADGLYTQGSIPSQQYDAAPVLDNMNASQYGGVQMTPPVYDEMSGDIPLVEDIVAPEDDVLPSAAALAAEALSGAPTVDDIAAPEFDELPSAAALAAEALNGAPTVDDIAAPEFDELPSAAALAAEALNGAPTVEDITVPDLDELASINDISAQAYENVSAPVLDDITAPIYNTPYMAEEEFEFNMSDYNNNIAPNPQGADTEQAQQPQIVKVPQFAGYDANNQPVYKYVPMRLMGYDQNGKPVFAPLNNQPAQAAAPAQQTAAQAQRAAAAPAQQPAQAPVRSSVPRKPVKTNGVPTANISKIAVNPHEKSTSQAFINAIASSKEYADKNLIETQGLKANSPILTSVEDVLSTMGDDSVKKKQAQQAQQNVPVFDEYKAPASKSSYGRSNNASPRLQQSYNQDARYMTKSELKAKKKQDKIDAKFRKEMSKRGF